MSLTFYFPPHPFHLSIRARLLSRIRNNFLSFHERDLAVTLLLTRDFIWLFKVKWTQSWNTFVYTHFEVSEKELAIKKKKKKQPHLNIPSQLLRNGLVSFEISVYVSHCQCTSLFLLWTSYLFEFLNPSEEKWTLKTCLYSYSPIQILTCRVITDLKIQYFCCVWSLCSLN